MRVVNSHRYSGSGDAPVAFIYDDSIGSYSLRVLPMTTTWTQALIEVSGDNGDTNVFPDGSGTISGSSLTTGGDTFDVCNSGATGDVRVISWYAQTPDNTIDTNLTIVSASTSASPIIHTNAGGFKESNGNVSIYFDGNDELSNATPNTGLASGLAMTIVSVTENTLALDQGNFFSTNGLITGAISNNPLIILHNRTTSKQTIQFSPQDIDSINTNTSEKQRIIMFYKKITSVATAQRNLAIDSVFQNYLSSSVIWTNNNVSLGKGFTGYISEVSIQDDYYNNVLTDLTDEVNTHYNSY